MPGDEFAETPNPPEARGAVQPPEGDQGSSLPDEYKPYSQIPWDSIPEESRQQVLEGVKKLHGGMTQNQQELAKLRQEVPQLRERSQMLDQLVNEPWVREAWQKQQGQQQQGQSSGNGQESLPDLTEHLDPDTAKAVAKLVDQKLSQQVTQLSNQVQSLQQQQANSQVRTDLARLRQTAEQKGWPPPDDKMQDMYRLITEGKAKDVESAYRLAVFDDLPDHLARKQKEQRNQELQKKAQTTVPPGQSSPSSVSPQGFSGTDAVEKALEQSLKEMSGG